MSETRFFQPTEAMSVASVASFLGVECPRGAGDIEILRLSALSDADRSALSFCEGPKYADELAQTRAGVCLVSTAMAGRVPEGCVALVVPGPYAAFIAVLRHVYSPALSPRSLFGATGVSPGATVHPDARVEPGAIIDPGVVVGPGAEIGAGTVVQSGAVVGPGVRIGRNCAIGAGATVTHALLGNGVILHPGVRVGQDGFGYAPGRNGHTKIPQIGRVIIQDHVEVGANTTIDRGAVRDTVIGEGTKIDNHVQIAHNVSIGRHCIIVAQCGIAGSSTLGDFVVLGASVGVKDHITVGAGSEIAATSLVNNHVPPGSRWGGWPAKPVREWFREVATLERLAKSGKDVPKNADP